MYLYAAEAVQVVTKDASKNRSWAFFSPLQPRVAGLYSLQVLLLDILSGDLFSYNTVQLRHNWSLLWSTQIHYPKIDP